jgi:phospholipid transport system transporter-binding protein
MTAAALDHTGDSAGDALFALRGDIGFAEVPRLHSQALAEFPGYPRLVVDLGGVTQANSAALAMLIEWLRLARRDGRELKLRNVPEPLLKLARLSELDAFLPIA